MIGAHAIRLYGRRWLKMTRDHDYPSEADAHAKGWRVFTWTDRLDEAEKFLSAEKAERFARAIRLQAPYAIIDLHARAA